MGYKSLLTVWDGRADSRPTLDYAIKMARKWDAHLNVLCLGIDHVQVGFYYAGASPALMAENSEVARAEAKRLEAEAEAILKNEDINWTVRAVVAQISGISWVVGQAARFNDLVILPKPYGRGATEDAAYILEAAMFEGSTPVLVCPTDFKGETGQKIVIGWNESPEALRAIRAAMPFLKNSSSVDVAIIDPPVHDEDQADPGRQISTMISRHGVDVDVSVLARTMPRVSETLQQHATDVGADMIVIGAYGHSRFRESILGGATRDLLEQAKFPVFMVH
ncbi:MAG: universal stress protein [Rhodobacter sp.]|jgi:nucleotide-binding universal stress UspA family protein|nr:universal stress protein [Rhodobacter sp.]